MIRLKQILESKITETPLADILGTSSEEQVPNVLFIGDSQTSDNNSYANNLINGELVMGDIIGKSNLDAISTAKAIGQYAKSDTYDIISIMVTNSINKTVSRTTRILEEVFKFAKRRASKLIVITNPIDFAIDIEEDPDAKDLQKLSEWVSSQNIADDVIDISDFRSSNFKDGYELSLDGQKEIFEQWKDILREYDFDSITSIGLDDQPSTKVATTKRSKSKSKKAPESDVKSKSDKTITYKPLPSKTTGDNGRLSASQLKSIGGIHKLDPAAADAYLAMKQTSYEDGLTDSDWNLSDSYRTYDQQNAGFDWDLYDKTGKKAKKGTNGRIAMAYPGTSNHGLGKAIDLSGKAQDWVRKNGEQFGWSWDEGKSVGEPWHFRYKL